MTDTIRKRRSSGRARIHDVAALAGVSAITVSRFFNEPERVSPALRSRIAAAVERTGYVQNLVAGGLASARGKIVAAIIPNIANSIFADTIQGLGDTLAKFGFQLLLASSGYSMEREENALRAILGWSPAAIVLTGSFHTPAVEQLLRQANMPIVETWDFRPERPYLQVGFSHRAVGRDTTRYLYDKGYRNIVFVEGGVAEDFRALERAAGYEETMHALGLKPTVFKSTIATPLEAGKAALLELTGRTRKTDAIIFANDNLAAGAILEGLRSGLKIPERCAIAGFGDFSIADKLLPSLTTIRPPRYEIGTLTAQIILRSLGESQDNDITAASTQLSYELVTRESA